MGRKCRYQQIALKYKVIEKRNENMFICLDELKNSFVYFIVCNGNIVGRYKTLRGARIASKHFNKPKNKKDI